MTNPNEQNKPTVCQIALPTPLMRCFDYLLPLDVDPECVQVGCRVRVSFHHRAMIGIVMGISDQSDYPIHKLKPIIEVIDETPILSEPIMTLAKWASDYYQYALGEVLFAALPAPMRQGKALIDQTPMVWQLTEQGKAIDVATLGRAKKQQALLSALQTQSLSNDDIKQLGVSTTQVKVCQNKAWIEQVPQKISQSQENMSQQKALTLNSEQQYAFDAITKTLNQFQVTLIEGVTGSGKTEVYLQVIQLILQQQKQVLVLVPEIGLTPQTIARFKQRFPVAMAVMHSGLTDKERQLAWQQARSGNAKIIIGTRSAIFSALPDLGLIIVDEEHDTSFKQQDGFRYSARDLSVMRSKLENIPIILGTATPSIESYHNAKQKRYQHLCLTQRAGDAVPPECKILDLRGQKCEEGISLSLFDAIENHLNNHGSVMLFVNRRGYAPTLICHECGWVACCDRCDARLTVHYAKQQLRCHHCDHQRRLINTCPSCQCQSLLPIGQGTQRLEAVLQQRFSDVGVARLDRDATAKKGVFEQTLADFESGKIKILCGTQMLAKGHHFPNLTLVAIIDIDGGLYSADFRSVEKMAQLIIQVSGRAGRADKKGQVILQTRNPHNTTLQILVGQDYRAFMEDLLVQRQQAALPPFSHLALFRAESVDKNQPMGFLQQLRDFANQHLPDSVSILGPIPSLMEKRAGRFRAQLMLQADHRAPLKATVKQCLTFLDNNPMIRKVRWSLDIDPVDMF